MMTLTASPETDLAVLRAIGLDGRIVEKYQQLDGSYKYRFVVVIGEKNPSRRPIWQPSTDLNDAFLAAEKFNPYGEGWPNWVLFQQRFLSQNWDAGWYMCTHDEGGENPETEPQPTPALAICAAILKLAEMKK
ncbi:MAG TPA: hypothetical protein VNH18_06470 [Bryobacteraceae bacterium]|nr:hypothetical protein [Bryobacteraceae bacterium]